ncbi:hypothetical protein TNCV_1229031 [Trichonephila clavipes]|nr:hypothetical protein TNCV_1229031 [Trichonephila clavipes]
MPPICHSQIEAHEIHRGNGRDVRLSLALALSTIQMNVVYLNQLRPDTIPIRDCSDNRKPNAIHAVYETGHYTNLENHHMRETCLKKQQNRCKMLQFYLYCGK